MTEFVGYGREVRYPRVQQVIISHQSRGKGEPNDPYRQVTMFHSLDGDFLGEYDDYQESRLEQLLREKENG